MLVPHEADPNREAEMKRLREQAAANGGATDWGVVGGQKPADAPKEKK